MFKPDFVLQEEWEYLMRSCIGNGVNPYIVIAIGLHETGWGELGWGKLGYILGVGCFSETKSDPAFQGYDAQITWATNALGKFLDLQPTEEELAEFAGKIWKPGAPEAWAKSVYALFQKMQKQNGVDLQGIKQVPEYAREALDFLFTRNILNTPFGTPDFYRCAEMLYRTIKKFYN